MPGYCTPRRRLPTEPAACKAEHRAFNEGPALAAVVTRDRHRPANQKAAGECLKWFCGFPWTGVIKSDHTAPASGLGGQPKWPAAEPPACGKGWCPDRTPESSFRRKAVEPVDVFHALMGRSAHWVMAGRQGIVTEMTNNPHPIGAHRCRPGLLAGTIILAAVSSALAGDTIWFDDAIPAGAWTGAEGGDAWNWVSNNPAPQSGTLAHQSNLTTGIHHHYFSEAAATLGGETRVTRCSCGSSWTPPIRPARSWSAGLMARPGRIWPIGART